MARLSSSSFLFAPQEYRDDVNAIVCAWCLRGRRKVNLTRGSALDNRRAHYVTINGAFFKTRRLLLLLGFCSPRTQFLIILRFLFFHTHKIHL